MQLRQDQHQSEGKGIGVSSERPFRPTRGYLHKAGILVK